MSSIDDEFEDIIAGLNEPDTPHVPATSGAGSPSGDISRTEGSQTGDPSSPETPFADETDPASAAGPVTRRHIALILVPISPAEELSKMLGFYGLARWVVPVGGPCAVYLPLEPTAADDFDALLGEERPLPEECDLFARTLSRLTKHGAVAIVSQLQEDETATNGDVIGWRYLGGEARDSVAAGIILNGFDQRVEDLLLGRTVPADYPDAVHPQERPEPPRRFGRPFRFGK